MKCINLSKNKIAILDDDDYENLSSFKWYAIEKGEKKKYFYARRRVYFGDGNKLNIDMHRFVMKAKNGEFVDHINGDTLDNRKNNLRICNKIQNGWNRAKGNGSSKYKGVYFRKDCSKWVARISANGNRLNLGYFDNEENAAKEYNKKAKILFKDFAKLNMVL